MSQMTRPPILALLIVVLAGCGAERSDRQRLHADEAFRAAHAARVDVVTTASGLQYRIVDPGTGRRPYASDRVSVRYHGTLVDGTVFDSSDARGGPSTFPVGRVIAGWIEALQLMREGAIWEVVIPPHLAYGRGGAAGIPPNATLIFRIELVQVH